MQIAAGRKPRSHRTRHPVLPGWQPVPLHRIRQNRAGRARRREETMRTRRSSTIKSCEPIHACGFAPHNHDYILIASGDAFMSIVEHGSKTHSNGKRYQVIGTRPIRHDGVDKVTGRAKYGADIQLTGMLYGVMLRSPHAHANIKSIDYS